MTDQPPPNLADAPTVASAELPDHLLAKLRVSVPGYELLDKIDAGGQATVYRARELTSGLTVAIKVLNGGPHATAAARERFHRETTALRALDHPNIVCAIEAGRTPLGLDYLVMNYVDGRPLDALWRDPTFAAAIAPEPAARLRLFKRICDVVQAAHLKGITHRDLSPSNILLTADGQPHVLDFGLASTAFNDLLTPAGQVVTVTGQFIGKIQYAAPEQARGGRDAIDIRTDVYALGVILYQILTGGAFPYVVVGNLVDVLNNIIHTKPLTPSAALAARQQIGADNRPLRKDPALVNATIEAVVLKALEKDPADRYQSAGELAADIDQYLAGRPTAASLRAAEAATPASGRAGKRRLALAARVLLLFGILAVVVITISQKAPRAQALRPATTTPTTFATTMSATAAASTAPSPADAAGIATLKKVLLDHDWFYSDSFYPPGDVAKFYPDGKFHRWRWSYWLVGPRLMHVQFWEPTYRPATALRFNFNEDLTVATCQFVDAKNNKPRKITLTRK